MRQSFSSVWPETAPAEPAVASCATSPAEPAVALRAVTKVYRSRAGQVTALREISASFAAGTFTAVMGASGSGKSTLLQCAAGLDRPTSGEIRLAGHDLGGLSETKLTTLRRQRIGFIFQSFNLLPSLTAELNVALTARPGTAVPALAALARADIRGLPVRVLTGDGRGAAEPDPDAGLFAVAAALLGSTSGVAGFVSVFVVAGTFAYSVAARRRELGLLRAVGATPRQVRRLVLGEALAVGAAGCWPAACWRRRSRGRSPAGWPGSASLRPASPPASSGGRWPPRWARA